jgi:ATP-dependent Clp protease protease subunit
MMRPDRPPLEDPVLSGLFERRTVTLFGELADDRATHLAAELMSLDALGDGPVSLVISSGGGSLHAALALIDVIDLLGARVHATCLGHLEGPPVGVMAVCQRRLIAPHARIRLCEDVATFEGRARDLEDWARQRSTELRRFCERVAVATSGRRPADEVEEDVRAGRFLSPAEALRYGLVDEIGRPEGTVLPMPRTPFGFR